LAALQELPVLAASCAAQQQQAQQRVQKAPGLGKHQAEAAVGVLRSGAGLEGELHSGLEGALRVLEQLLLRNEQHRPLLEEHVEQLVQCLALLMGYQVRGRNSDALSSGGQECAASVCSSCWRCWITVEGRKRFVRIGAE